MPDLMTFQAAQEWLASRVLVRTSLSSAELALPDNFPVAARAQAFFSARVSSSSILEALKEQVDQLAEGTVNIATARVRLKTFLAAQGFAADDVGMTDTPPIGVDPEDWKARKQIVNLASTRRLDLILRQNAAMSHAVGRREVSLHPAIKERWPYFRYLSRDDAAVRPGHKALDNLVLPKDDPFWHTHTPPWDYNCRCDIEDADEEEAATIGGVGKVVNGALMHQNGQVHQILPNQSGFTWDIDQSLTGNPNDFDWDAIRDPLLRGIARSEMDEITDLAPAAKPEPKPDSDNFYGMSRSGDLERVQVGSREVKTKTGKKRQVPVYEWRRGGKAVADAEADRANGMKLPPGWSDVYVAADPEAKLQAIGRDAKGRVQRRYSAAFTEEQARKKFARVRGFSRALPNMRTRAEAERAKGRAEAFVFDLEDRTTIRMGNPRDIGARVHAYGITTLEGRHVSVKGDVIHLDFIGKEGVPCVRDVRVPQDVADFVAERAKTAGPDGRLWPEVSGAKMNTFIRAVAGGEKYSIKDFRTHHATRLARGVVSRHEGETLTDAERKAIVAEACEAASAMLNNAPQMAYKSYIDPAVWDAIGGSGK